MVVLHPELLEKILLYHSDCNQTLVSASLTAKAFSEPAFNVLWFEIRSIWPIFRILPTFERGADGKYSLTGPIRDEHLQRMLYYAKRIRVLDYFIDEDDSLYSNVSRDLITSTIMSLDKLAAFFPLRNIRLCETLCDTPLTTPNLDNVDVQELKSSTEIKLATFLQSVAKSPLLRSLTIHGRFSDITLQVLPDFTNLHTLSVVFQSSAIPVHFLKRLASSMPSLQDLRIYIFDPPPASQNDGPQRFGQPHSRLSFSSLETLHVAADSTHLEILFDGLDAPLLKTISLEIDQAVPDDSGRLLKFVERNHQLLNDKVHSVTINTVIPSLSFIRNFKKLSELVIDCDDGPIPLSGLVDASWSHSLIHLRLFHWDRPNGVSIAALRFIADTCPNLKELTISIHHPERPKKPTKTDEEDCKRHGLENLYFVDLPEVWDDSISLAVEFVSLLVHLFPSMAVPKFTGDVMRPTRGAWWRGVEDMWRMCQTIKGQRR